ncbi:hypothetical protein BC940DRAFT_306072 [Gongronella butleri]|nr:hypothetical protein BC940DRAFT_306072 [Gongronella butleri]
MMELLNFPPELIQLILAQLPLKDLARTERTCKQLQLASLFEMQRRTANMPSDFGLLVHLKQTAAQWQQFDPLTKTAEYKVQMTPITIKSMYDHKRLIQCSLLRKHRLLPVNDHAQLAIPLDKGLEQGKTVHVSIQHSTCQLEAAITRMAAAAAATSPSSLLGDQKKQLAPQSLAYSVQITSMRLPLSTIAV